jgi:hypothetical protein
MLDGATEGEPGLWGETEHVCSVPDVRTVGRVGVLFGERLIGHRPDRDHQEVLSFIEEEGMMVRESGRVGAGIPDLDFVEEGGDYGKMNKVAVRFKSIMVYFFFNILLSLL